METKDKIIDKISDIRTENNKEWIELERLAESGSYINWDKVRFEREKSNAEKMWMLKYIFRRYPDKAKKIFAEITENDRKINVLSEELCK